MLSSVIPICLVLVLAACLLAKAQARQSFERDMELSLKCSGEAVALLERT